MDLSPIFKKMGYLSSFTIFHGPLWPHLTEKNLRFLSFAVVFPQPFGDAQDLGVFHYTGACGAVFHTCATDNAVAGFGEYFIFQYNCGCRAY